LYSCPQENKIFAGSNKEENIQHSKIYIQNLRQRQTPRYRDDAG